MIKKLLASGCLFYATSTGRVLLNLRSDKVTDSNTWGTWGGLMNEDETPFEALKREVKEECNFDFDLYKFDYLIYPVVRYNDLKLLYYNYLIVIENEFNPIISTESSGFEWVDLSDFETLNKFMNFHSKFERCIPYYIKKIENFKINENLNESELMEAKAKSKSQRRLMAMAYAYKHGKLSEKYASPAVVKLSQLKDEFLKEEASTDQKKRKKDGSVSKRDAIPYKVRKKINKI